jgi:3-deoxy-7-phosphoheptulonate synthase
VLRGGRTPNCDAASLERVAGLLVTSGLPPSIMVDCSHGNSQRDPARQPVIAQALTRARHPELRALMLESNLIGGRQEPGTALSKCITDSCLGFDETTKLLDELGTT